SAAPAAEPPVAADDGVPAQAAAPAASPATQPAVAQEGVTTTAAAPASAPAADGPVVPAAFDVASVPPTAASLPPFPFFEVPEGLESTYRDDERELSFDAQYFIAGAEPLLVEGRVFRDRFNLAGGARRYTELEFHRNYENAVKALGGVKVNRAQY